MTTSSHDILLAEVEDFLKRHDMAPTTFGTLAANDMKLVSELRDGRDIRLSTADRIRRFMREYTPPRPKPRLSPYQPAA